MAPFLLGALSLAAVSAQCGAEVFLAQDEALKLAFPGNQRVVRRSLVITDEQKEKIENLAQAKLESKLFTFYEGRLDGRLSGFAVIDAHIVRSQREVFMLVLEPNGAVRKVVILAFFEPREHLASERWLEQFQGKSSPQGLLPGREIAPIVGSTLTAQAVSAGVRKILAVFNVLHLAQDTRAGEGA